MEDCEQTKLGVGYASRTITPVRHLMIAMDSRFHRRGNASLGVWVITMSCAEKGTRCVPYTLVDVGWARRAVYAVAHQRDPRSGSPYTETPGSAGPRPATDRPVGWPARISALLYINPRLLCRPVLSPNQAARPDSARNHFKTIPKTAPLHRMLGSHQRATGAELAGEVVLLRAHFRFTLKRQSSTVS